MGKPLIVQDFRGHSRQLWHMRYQNQAGWTDQIREYILKVIHLPPRASVLEVGSGTGVQLERFSKYSDCHLFGIDIDWPSLFLCRTLFPSFPLAQAAGACLPFANNSFDLTFCHYFLMWDKNPEIYLYEMMRVTKRGGWLLALAEPDYKARIDFPPPLHNLGSLQTRSLQNQGINPQIGRELKSLFLQIGLQEVTAGVLAAQWTPDGAFDQTEWVMLHGDLSDQLTEDQLRVYYEEDQSAYQSGTRILYVPTFYALGRLI